MPKKADFIFEVRIRIPEAFTLDSIVRKPRTFKPKDVLSACQNNQLELKHGEPPEKVTALANYVITDFFAMAHGTGLYNRQKDFWESLSKINTVHVVQLNAGIFKKRSLPVYDFTFLDYKNKPLVIANLVTAIPKETTAIALIKSFISRTAGHSSLTGILCCFACSLPPEALQFVRSQTQGHNAVSHYEALLQGINRPFDLLTMQRTTVGGGEQQDMQPETRLAFQLLHPDITTRKTKPAGTPSAYQPKPVSEMPPYKDIVPHKD